MTCVFLLGGSSGGTSMILRLSGIFKIQHLSHKMTYAMVELMGKACQSRNLNVIVWITRTLKRFLKEDLHNSIWKSQLTIIEFPLNHFKDDFHFSYKLFSDKNQFNPQVWTCVICPLVSSSFIHEKTVFAILMWSAWVLVTILTFNGHFLHFSELLQYFYLFVCF